MGQVAGEKSFQLSEDELALLNRIRGGQNVRELLVAADVPQSSMAEYLQIIRRLGELGSIDILS